jgi:transposase-like protein
VPEREKFLTDLYRRGLTGEGLDMICVDCGSGLLAALPTIFPSIAVQCCWAHKIRNVFDKVKKADQPAVKRAPHKIMNAPNAPAARAAARKFANRFESNYPAAVACLRNDLDLNQHRSGALTQFWSLLARCAEFAVKNQHHASIIAAIFHWYAAVLTP